MDIALAIGNPDPDLVGAVCPAWVHLTRLGCKSYAQRTALNLRGRKPGIYQ